MISGAFSSKPLCESDLLAALENLRRQSLNGAHGAPRAAPARSMALDYKHSEQLNGTTDRKRTVTCECLRCLEPAHSVIWYPTIPCYNCEKKGRISQNCPEKERPPQMSTVPAQSCLVCSTEGAVTTKCPKCAALRQYFMSESLKSENLSQGE